MLLEGPSADLWRCVAASCRHPSHLDANVEVSALAAARGRSGLGTGQFVRLIAGSLLALEGGTRRCTAYIRLPGRCRRNAWFLVHASSDALC